jgi:lipid-A-disaccharide synthase
LGWRFNAKAGGTLVKHYRELAFMGFVEVLFNLKTILAILKYAKMILPNSNLMSLFLLTILALIRIAKWARKTSQHTITYRPKYGLGKKIASLTSKDVDKMYVILPFENIL